MGASIATPVSSLFHKALTARGTLMPPHDRLGQLMGGVESMRFCAASRRLIVSCSLNCSSDRFAMGGEDTMADDESPEMPKRGLLGTISNEHYAAIGRAADKWSDFEFEIDRTIWNLLRVKHPLGACVTAQLYSALNKMRALIALVNLYELDDSIPKDLNKLSAKIGPLIEKRNRTIHDKRFVHAGTFDVIRFQVTAHPKLTFGPQQETIDSLYEFCNEVEGFRQQFLEIVQRIETATTTSGGKLKPLPGNINRLQSAFVKQAKKT
jgi:hypothetical protein